jgi:hypothetical protein
MSSSSETTGSNGIRGPAQTVELRIQSPAGVEYRVFNGQGDECFRGYGDQQIALPQGLYAIQWLSAGTKQETLLRVTNRNEPTLAVFPRETAAAATDSGAAS